MPTGIRPRVNEAREFLEIAKDFKNPKEIIREALSNSWDAGATEVSLLFDLVPISGTRKKKLRVTIEDNGDGMSSDQRPNVGSSEIEGFFNLGDSAKPTGSIGSKGHGTKIYYRSHGLSLDTWKNGRKIHAEIETDPWDALLQGYVPTFGYEESDDSSGKGTHIVVDGFEAKQNDFSDLDELLRYISWYTIAGSIGPSFGQDRKMRIKLRPASGGTIVSVDFGFQFPQEFTDLSDDTANVCKIFGPESLNAGVTTDGREVIVQVMGALLGDSNRSMVPKTYEQMGLWFAKDFIRIERNNLFFERAFGGQYFYRNFLIIANCQQFDLTANRNNIRTSGEEYELANGAIEEWFTKLKSSEFTVKYFERKKEEDNEEKRENDEKQQKEKEQKALSKRSERLSLFKGRASLLANGVVKAPLKEPRNEAETALLLQAMISSKHAGIDFVIGEYNTTLGVDLAVEREDKGFKSIWWVELVLNLDKINQWSHHPDGFHAIVCYDLGKVAEEIVMSNKVVAKLVKKQSPGRYALMLGKDTLEVYVLREILQG